MVTLITEKLRNQTLEDGQFEPISQGSRRSWELTAPGVSSFNFTTNPGKKDWSLSLSNSDSWRPGELRAAVAAAKAGIPPTDIPFLPNVPPDLIKDSSPSTPPAPPKKRHCRSLSIPGDGKLGKQWQPQASSIWRPVAVRASHGAKHKRNSPHCLHKSKIVSSPSPLSALVSANCHSPRTGRWSVASSEFVTPPESPIPRPASASSGFYDSSQGSLNAALSDASPTPVQDAPYRCYEAFKARSLSVEEAISSGGVGLRRPGSCTGVPSGSMPVIPYLPNSTPSSPQRQRVPRSRSQPCVLHDRKCGIKRRRDEDRPRLNLLKMSETAYERRFATSKARGIQCAIPSYTDPPECFLGLNTIASSPLDGTSSHMSSTQTLTVVTPKASPEREKVFRLDGKSFASGLTPSRHGDRLSDSGCSENELSELSPLGFVDAEENSFNDSNDFNDDCVCVSETNVPTEVPVFELEMNNELDLEQIEKD